MLKIFQIILFTLFLLVNTNCSFALPAGFKITEIANTTGENVYKFYAWPGINENGQVCYRGSNDAGNSAILRGDGNVRTIIEKTKVSPNFLDEFSSGICSISNSGTVVFDACKNCLTDSDPQIDGIYSGDGTGASSLLQGTSAGDTGFKTVSIPTINNNGVISFVGERNNGLRAVWFLDSGVLSSAIDNTGFLDELGAAFINDQSSPQLTFGGIEDSVAGVSHRGIYGPNNANRITGTFNGFSTFGFSVINNTGDVASLASKSAAPGTLPESGVYLNGLARVVNNTGEFSRADINPFQNVSINDLGDLVFPAVRANGKQVVFLAVTGGMFKLFERGDLIPGHASPIEATTVGRESINNQRQIALVVTLQDKTQLVLRLDPNGFSVPVDNCPSDQNKFEPGVCGCSIADSDNNSDGIIDCKTTGEVLNVAQSLSGSLKKIKKLKSNAKKSAKKAQSKLKSTAKAQLKQLLLLVSKGGSLIKLKNTSSTAVKLSAPLKSQVPKALKTDSRTFTQDKKKASSTLSKFIKVLDSAG